VRQLDRRRVSRLVVQHALGRASERTHRLPTRLAIERVEMCRDLGNARTMIVDLFRQ